MFKCTNCNWVGEKPYKYNDSDPFSNRRMDGKCPVCGDNVVKVTEQDKLNPVEEVTKVPEVFVSEEVKIVSEPEESNVEKPVDPEPVKNEFDLNNDGKIDKKDVNLAGKVLKKTYKKKR